MFARVGVVVGLLTLGGCIDAVTLARDCIGRTAACAPVDDPPPMMLDASPRDASVLDASFEANLDARVPDVIVPDAAIVVDASAALPGLGLANGTFEITRGGAGGIALSVFEPIPIGANLVEPWAACRFGFSARERADSVFGSGAGDVLPRDGNTFIEADIGISGLRQKLPTPLRSAERYTFRIDARAAVGAGITLELWGSNSDCAANTKLAELPRLSESWDSYCVSFIAPSELPQLMLMTSARGTSTSTSRMFFDWLREDASCP